MKPVTVLLVDDDDGVTFLNRFLLESSGHDLVIQTAINGSEALKIIEQAGACPDIILLDVNMPVMDGFEFLQALSERQVYFKTANVYMLTSSLRETDRQAAAKFSCVKRYLEKPLTEEMVKELLG